MSERSRQSPPSESLANRRYDPARDPANIAASTGPDEPVPIRRPCGTHGYRCDYDTCPDVEERWMQPGDDRFPPLIEALHKERAEGHTERADCWACAAVGSAHVQRLAIDSSTLATLDKAMARYGAPDHLTPLSRFYWLLERQPSANAIHAEWERLDAERLSGGSTPESDSATSGNAPSRSDGDGG